MKRQCEHCGASLTKGQKRYCTRSCAGAARTGKSNSNWKGGKVKRICEVCSTVFYAKRKDVRKGFACFCGRKCFGVWRSRTLISEDACHWQGGPVTVQCEYCGEKYEVPQNRAEITRFCSKSCMGKWRIAFGDFSFPQASTSIEIIVSEALDNLGIEHIQQYQPEGYPRIYDEYIPPSVLIEVQGTYWHSSPKARERDAEKSDWAIDNGFKLIELWDHEIESRGVSQLIAERIMPLLETL